jgi:hypothetical protein
MKKSAVNLAIFVALGSLHAQMVTIKGHHLGETVSEFIQSDIHIRQNLTECHAGEPKAITSDQVQAMNHQQIYDLGLLLGGPSKKELEKLAAAGKLFTEDSRFPAQKAYCQGLVNALEKGDEKPFFAEILFPDSHLPTVLWAFEAGRLSEVGVSMYNEDFVAVEGDMTKKVGFKPELSQPAMHNAMGAAWNNQVAVWMSPDLVARLVDDRNPAEPSLELSVVSRKIFDDRVKRQAAAHSPLDTSP